MDPKRWAAAAIYCDLPRTRNLQEKVRGGAEPGMHLWFEDRRVMRQAGIEAGSGDIKRTKIRQLMIKVLSQL